MNKKSLWLIVMVLLFTLLMACAPDREEGSSNAESNDNSNNAVDEEKPEKPEELTVWANDEDKHLKAVEKFASDYEEQFGIKVNVVAKSMLDQLQELSLAGPEGKGPDIFLQPHDQTGNIVAQGLAEPLVLSDEEKSGYSDAAIDSVTYNYDGQTDIYGIPAVIETYGVFYNKDIISDAPENIDDLKAILKEKTDASKDQYGFLMKPNDLYFAYPFFKNHGGYIFGGDVGEYDTSDIGLANEGSVQGAELFQTLFGEGKVPASTTVDVVDGLFAEGKVGAVLNGPWSISSYKDVLGDKVGFAPFPKIAGEPSQTLVGVKSWYVSYYSENKEWAKDLAVFMTNEDNFEHYFETVGELPPNNDVLEAIEDPLYSAFAEQIKHGVPMPSTPQMSQVWEPMNNALQFIAEGEDAESVLEEAVNQIEDNIAASGAK